MTLLNSRLFNSRVLDSRLFNSRLLSLSLPFLLLLGLIASGCTSNKDASSSLLGQVPTNGPTTTVAVAQPTPPCDGKDGVGGAVPQGAQPGDLIAASNLEQAYGTTAGYPTNAKVWRILYVSTGFDESDLQLVCGMAAAPADGPQKSTDGLGHLLTWAHGTIGLQQACLPSSNPATALWGKMASGIGAVAWGAGPGARVGSPSDGLLQTALNRGWVVSTTDYQPNDTYILGKLAASNVIDAARATTQLMAQQFGPNASPPTATELPSSYDTISLGHSQGGHAAMWTAQLYQSYLEGTANPDTTPLRLRGAAIEAPASNLISQPELQPGVELGQGLADWEMHQSIQLIGLPIGALELQVGPALFSYIFGSWAQFSARGTPAADSKFPAFPSNAANLDLSTVATDQGAATIASVMPLCLGGSDAKIVKKLVSPYRNAAKNKMLTPSLWNLPEQYKADQFFAGGADKTCAETTEQSMTDWCQWIRWNIPGPLGAHPFPKFPNWDNTPVPLMIAQGANDPVIHCIPPKGSSATQVPDASNCMSSALYDSLKSQVYCPEGQNAGHLQLSVFRKDGQSSPAGHLAIPGQIAAAGLSKNPADLVFTGSPLDKFITASFDGTAEPGCTSEILNP
ncbi:MAG: lipase family protein [Microthrixaceae bacterium]